jgi:hypothetical protein
MNSGRAVRQTRRKGGHAHPLQPTFYHFGELYVQTRAVVNVLREKYHNDKSLENDVLTKQIERNLPGYG